MNWVQALSDYRMYLQIERGLSENSILNYALDIKSFQAFLSQIKSEEGPLGLLRENPYKNSSTKQQK